MGKVNVPVVLVEDNAEIQQRLKTLMADLPRLSLAGVADSAEQACETIRRERPQVVILDLALRSGSGWDVLASLDPARAPRVFVFTNHAEPEFRSRALKAGAAGFFDKSVDFESLAETLRAL